jgi:hypothetical protein
MNLWHKWQRFKPRSLISFFENLFMNHLFLWFFLGIKWWKVKGLSRLQIWHFKFILQGFYQLQ